MRLMDDTLAITCTEEDALHCWDLLDDADHKGHFKLNREKTRTNVAGVQGSQPG
jgi:hypothetical protein